MTDKKRDLVYLAGLLHDIGKFYQRADVYYKNSPNLTSNQKALVSLLASGKIANAAHHHVLWTHAFLNDPAVVESLQRLSITYNKYLEENSSDDLMHLSCNHHNPQTLLQSFIQAADWWSHGMNRTTYYANSERLCEKYEEVREVLLKPVFEKLLVNQKEGEVSKSSIPLEALNISAACLPQQDQTYQQSQYENLWNSFIDEVKNIPVADAIDYDPQAVKAFGETLLFLLRKYAWCVPAGVHRQDQSDINLFDHSRTTAAIAQCLYDYWIENQDSFSFSSDTNDKNLKINRDTYPLLLFCGDISGIQKYIYDIYSSKAAKSLKGRSFFLQLLVESLIQQLCTQCEVTLGHVVYASGGKFYMLLPNTPKVIQAISGIEKETAQNIHDEYHGALYVCMDYIPFCYHFEEGESKISMLVSDKEENSSANLGDLWRKLAEKTGLKKQQKFKQVMLDKFDAFFKPEKIINVENVCAVTGQFFSNENDKKEIGKDEAGQSVYVKAKVFEQIELGLALKDADYFLTYKTTNLSKELNISSFEPLSIGISHHLFDSRELTLTQADFRKINRVDTARVRRINQTDFLQTNKLKGNLASYGFTFYGGNQQAKVKDEKSRFFRYKTFEELTEYADHKSTKLGVLRMDVDNLGKLFIQGIPQDRRNISRYATLSSQLDWFFSGYLNTIRDHLHPESSAWSGHEQKDKTEYYRDWVNILYSGGDDVFAIGRWDMLIHFAEEIRSRFRELVGNRKDISISAGIAIIAPKFPIAKAAELAGEAEEKAKKFTLEGEQPRKNAFCLFGEVVSWENEFAEVKRLKNELVNFIEKQQLSAAILHKLITFQSIKNKNTEKARDLSYKWNAAYFLSRYEEQYKGKSDHPIRTFLDRLKINLFTGGDFTPHERYYDLAALAARWAEYELKSS